MEIELTSTITSMNRFLIEYGKYKVEAFQFLLMLRMTRLKSFRPHLRWDSRPCPMINATMNHQWLFIEFFSIEEGFTFESIWVKSIFHISPTFENAFFVFFISLFNLVFISKETQKVIKNNHSCYSFIRAYFNPDRFTSITNIYSDSCSDLEIMFPINTSHVMLKNYK